MSSALLLLADGRLPAGGHAHSGGLEEAVAAGRVRDAESLQAYLAGRLVTTGRTDAAIAAATWAAARPGSVPGWETLDAEAAARVASPALRRAGRAQGRGLLRAGRRSWPSAMLDTLAEARPAGPLWPVALGAVGRAAGCAAVDVALVAAHNSVTSPAWAATRLLGLDPFAVARSLASLAGAIDAEARSALACGTGRADLATLPAPGSPLSDLGAEAHATWEVRLFAS